MSGRPASGDRRWPVRGPILAGIIAVVVLVGGFTVWAVTTRISGAVVAMPRMLWCSAIQYRW